jgi:hypothetical protein
MPKTDASAMPGAYARSMCETAMHTQSTDGRTYGLTQKHLALRSKGSATYRGRPYDEPIDFDAVEPFGAILVDVLPSILAERTRWPRLRSGERERIPWAVRRLVTERDGGTCRNCGGWYDELQLDHVTPWSAYGPDSSTNLRLLCASCNDERSNYRDPYERPQIGVTSCCFWCWIDATTTDGETELEDVPEPSERLSAYCGRCGTTSWVPDTRWFAGEDHDEYAAF